MLARIYLIIKISYGRILISDLKCSDPLRSDTPIKAMKAKIIGTVFSIGNIILSLSYSIHKSFMATTLVSISFSACVSLFVPFFDSFCVPFCVSL